MQDVVAAAAGKLVVTCASAQLVVVVIAEKTVVARAAHDIFDPDQGVVPDVRAAGGSGRQVDADALRRAGVGDGVGAAAPADDIIAGAAGDGVVAGIGENRVAAGAGVDNGVGDGRADDELSVVEIGRQYRNGDDIRRGGVDWGQPRHEAGTLV